MAGKQKLRITAFPRIHLTLIGMNMEGYRINGGAGFSISRPETFCTFSTSKNFEFSDQRRHKCSDDEISRLSNRMEKIARDLKLKQRYRLVISGESMPHVGLGTGTSIFMAATEALFLLNGVHYSNKMIQENSGRGGTSGIGINTYFTGGFVFDAGVRANERQSLEPSSAATYRRSLPLCLATMPTPDWPIGIVIPANIKNKTQAEEIEFFRTACPISESGVRNILYHVVYGAVASLIESDYDQFSRSISAIQETEWKKLERGLYGKPLEEIEEMVKKVTNGTCGMSSLGPGIFFLPPDETKTHVVPHELSVNFMTRMNNSGRILSYD